MLFNLFEFLFAFLPLALAAYFSGKRKAGGVRLWSSGSFSILAFWDTTNMRISF